MLPANAMTIGQLSRHTGVPIKVLRTYEGLGFLYTLGRSESNYRLFGQEALWCVQVIQGLRSLLRADPQRDPSPRLVLS